MPAKLIVIIAFSFLYGAFEVFMNLRQGKSSISNSGDKGSLRLLYLSISAGYFLAFTAASFQFGRIYHWDALFLTGAVVALIGLTIRIGSIRTLKHYFTYSVAKIAHQELVTTGFYRYIRHPGYLGQLLVFLGLSLSLSNWLSILCMMVSVLIGYLYRISVEEEFMALHMGSEYASYKLRTKRLIPGIY